MKQTAHHLLAALGVVIGLALVLPRAASAGARSDCLDQCQQTMEAESLKCKADYKAEMVRCGNLATNQERLACNAQANTTLKACEKGVSEKAKLCKRNCPPKK